MEKKLYNIFMIIFPITFIIIFLGTIFDNKSLIVITNPIISIISLIIVGLILTFIYKLIMKKVKENISIKKEVIICSIIGGIFLIIQLVYAFYMTRYPGWDWGDVYSAALNFAQGNKELVNWEYFQMFPNNNALLYFETIIFKVLNIFGLLTIRKSIVVMVIINILFIDLSVLFLYLTVRNILGKREAIFSLIICTLSYAFYCYIPVFYTDTLTMLFPILYMYLYSKYLKDGKNHNLILIAIFSVIGYKLKPTTIISIVAIFIDFILKKKIKKDYKSYISFGLSFLLFFLIISFIEVKCTIMPYDIKNNNKEIPYTHWVMMGMTERDSSVEGRKWIGWYNPESVNYTLKYKTTNERKKANIKKIKEQYNDMGVVNYIQFLYRKSLFTWSDVSFYAPALVTGETLYRGENIVSKYSDSKITRPITFYSSLGMFLFMYLIIILSTIKDKKRKNYLINYARVSLFGLVLFLLIWEDSSRYLITYIPVMLLCTIYGLNVIINKGRKDNNKECKTTDNKIIGKSLRGNKMKKEPILYVVVPCYNEEEVLEETTKQLKAKMESLINKKEISAKSKVMYVNDGSKDKTWEIIKKINKTEKLFTGVTLSRNRGHQNALLGGLMTAKNYADIIISMDADLQDDINAMDEMIKKYKEGNEIVYGVRSARKKDTFFKRVTAEGFYKFMKFLGVDCVYNHADYRLTSKVVLDEFENFKEVNLFLRGMFPLVGYKSDVVYYERNERFAGESKYPLKKMLNFAWDGITSFSVKPLRFICIIGFIILFVSIAIMLYSLIMKLTGQTIAGWTFLSISIWFIGGLQMISIGIIGEYVGKMYSETKARPRFIISENLEESKK